MLFYVYLEPEELYWKQDIKISQYSSYFNYFQLFLQHPSSTIFSLNQDRNMYVIFILGRQLILNGQISPNTYILPHKIKSF